MAAPTRYVGPFGLWWHWASCAAVFALAGAYMAWRWPADRWRVAAINVTLGLIGGQIIEPLLEGIPFGEGIGWDVPPDRWAAFGLCAAAGIASLVIVLAVWPRPRTKPALHNPKGPTTRDAEPNARSSNPESSSRPRPV